jgi:hypothetical protein
LNNPSTGELDLNASGSYVVTSPKVVLNSPNNVIGSANLGTQGGVNSGTTYNYAAYSNTLNASTWITGGGSVPTVTCATTDDFGNPACQFVATASGNWLDFNNASLTNLTLNAQYSIQMRMKGNAGGELVTLGLDFQSSTNIALTTSWANYCQTFTASNAVGLNRWANIGIQAASTFFVSNVSVAPGNACGLPIKTTNNQFLTPTIVNHVGTWDANAYTLAGVAEGSANGIPGPLTASAILPLAQQGTGTPAAGKYVDGAAGAWTALPLQTVNTCGTTTTCANTAQASPRIVHGNVALTAGSAVVGSMTAWTATTSFDCTGTDKTALQPVQIVNTSTTSITITGTATDVIAYTCVGN